MLLVCYTNHFNHRICRVLEEPLTPPLPALRFKVAIHLQLHSVCWIPYVHFHFFWRSHSIPRSTDERKAWLVHQLENRVNFPARRKNPDEHPLHAHMYYKLEWDNCRSMLATIDSSLFVSLSKQLVQMSVVTFTQGFHSHFLFNTSLDLDSIIQWFNETAKYSYKDLFKILFVEITNQFNQSSSSSHKFKLSP